MPSRDTIWQLVGIGLLLLLAAAYTSRALSSPTSSHPTGPLVATLDTTWHQGCYDGDTCQFITRAGLTIRVRLARIDTPEIASQCAVRARSARQELVDLLSNRRIRIVPIEADPYDRLVAELYIISHQYAHQHTNVSDYLLQRGLATKYGEPTCRSHQMQPRDFQ